MIAVRENETSNSQSQFDLNWCGTLSDYVTAIAWSPQGKTLAAGFSCWEVMFWRELPSQGGRLATATNE